MRLRTTLDDHGLIQEIARGGRTYRVFYVGRWVYGGAPTGGGAVPSQGVLPPVRRLLLVRHGRAGGPRRARSRPAARRRRRGTGRRGHHGLLRRARHVPRWASCTPPTTRTTPGCSTRSAPTTTRAASTWGPLGEGLYWYLRCADRFGATAAHRGELGCGGEQLPSTASWRCFPTATCRAASTARAASRPPAAIHAPLLGTLALDGAAEPTRRRRVRQAERARRHQLHLPDLGLRARRPRPRRAALPGLRRGAG